MEEEKNSVKDSTDLGDVGLDAAGLLEQKKQEIVAAGGGIYALKEAIASHGKHVEKVRTEMQEAVTAGKMTAEVANFILSHVAKTRKVLDDCLSMFRTRYDVKTGEALAYDSIARKSRELKSQKAVPPTQPAEPTPDPEVPAVLDEMTSKKPLRGRGSRPKKPKADPPPFTFDNPPAPVKTRERPDARGKVGETVRRMKEARKSRENGEGETKPNS